MPVPVNKRLQGIFIPVADIEQAREWYSRVLGFPFGKISGRLSCVQLENGAWVGLDAKLRGPDGQLPVFQVPVIQFQTDDIEAAYSHMIEQGVEVVTPIKGGYYFNFRDPDGNVLMMWAPPRRRTQTKTN